MENINRTYNNLRCEFRAEVDRFSSRDNRAGTDLHRYQVDFCYALSLISTGTGTEVHEGIATATAIIEEIRAQNETA